MARKSRGPRVVIVKVGRSRSGYFEEIHVHCRLSRLRFVVSLRPGDFEKELKKAIAQRLVCEFAFLRAKSNVGRNIPLEEILQEGEVRQSRMTLWDDF